MCWLVILSPTHSTNVLFAFSRSNEYCEQSIMASVQLETKYGSMILAVNRAAGDIHATKSSNDTAMSGILKPGKNEL
jgi:hypothetical protein